MKLSDFISTFIVGYYPEWKSWGVTEYDCNGDQVGESSWSAYKNDAIYEARQLWKNSEKTITILKKSNEIQRIIV